MEKDVFEAIAAARAGISNAQTPQEVESISQKE